MLWVLIRIALDLTEIIFSIIIKFHQKRTLSSSSGPPYEDSCELLVNEYKAS